MSPIPQLGWRGFRVKWRWILLALILALYFQQIRDCVMVFSPKVGRVVDVTTGKGIPNAAVIAVALLRADKAYGGDGVYRVITYTDADGNYRVPNTWSHAWGETTFFLITMRAAVPRVRWVITALKPGYAFVGDDLVWSSYDNFGFPRYLPPSTVAKPDASWRGIDVEVAPMQLKPVVLNVKQAASHYYSIVGKVGAAGGPSLINKVEELRLIRPVYDYLLPKVCGENENVTLDSETAGNLEIFSPGSFIGWPGNKYTETLRKLEPDGFNKRETYPVFVGNYGKHMFYARNICTAMKAGT